MTEVKALAERIETQLGVVWELDGTRAKCVYVPEDIEARKHEYNQRVARDTAEMKAEVAKGGA